MGGPFARVNQYIIPDTSYIDTGLTNGTTYYYRVKAVNSVDTCYETKRSNMVWNTPQGIETASDTVLMTGDYQLGQNRPNPFRSQTRIEGHIPKVGPVEITVCNCAGQVVRNLSYGFELSGEFSVLWDGCDNTGKSVSSGIYFYSLQTPNTQLFRQLIKID